MRGNDGISGVEQWGRRVRGRVNLGLFYNCLNCLTGYSGVDLGYFKGKWVTGCGVLWIGFVRCWACLSFWAFKTWTRYIRLGLVMSLVINHKDQ